MGMLRRFAKWIVHVFAGGVEYNRRMRSMEVDSVWHHVHGELPEEPDMLLRRRTWLDRHAPPRPEDDPTPTGTDAGG